MIWAQTHREQDRQPGTGTEFCLVLKFWQSCLSLCKERWEETERGVEGERGGEKGVRAAEVDAELRIERSGCGEKPRGSQAALGKT